MKHIQIVANKMLRIPFFKKTEIIDNLTEDIIKNILGSSGNIKEVDANGDGYIYMKLKKNKYRPFVKFVNNNRLIFANTFETPKGREFAILLATTIWNDDKESSHNTFAYTTLNGVCVLESHLSVYNGITKKYIIDWADGFATKIPFFDDVLKENLKNQKKDSDIIKYIKDNGFNQAILDFAVEGGIELAIRGIGSVIKTLAKAVADGD